MHLKFFKNLKLSNYIILLILAVGLTMNLTETKKITTENVIEWDIKSYYAYLPAAIIQNDMSLSFMNTDKSRNYWKWIWPKKTENGDKVIITTYGLSILYLPFFLIGHIIALIGPWKADGYSIPYAFAIILSMIFYVALGLYYLRKFLKLYFDEISISIALVVIFFGTNLLYYSVYSPMTHAYNFALISFFLWQTHIWHDNPTIKKSIFTGLIFGVITVIRPTNILLALFFIFYGLRSLEDFKGRFFLYLKNVKLLIVISLAVLLAWVPQFLYWYSITGDFLYYSYQDEQFFWKYPQIYNILISFRKGWFIYTPLMLFAVLGLVISFRRYFSLILPVVIVLIPFIYVQSTWWSWWFGGSFGQRVFVDIYPLMAIPLTASIFILKKKWKVLFAFFLLGLLLASLVNIQLMRRFNAGSLHYYWNSKEAYFGNFFNKYSDGRYYMTVPIPKDRNLKKGLYVADNLIERYDGQYPITSKMILNEIIKELDQSRNSNDLKSFAERFSISIDSAIDIKARNIYEQRFSLKKYVRPIEKRMQALIEKKYGPAIEYFSQTYENVDTTWYPDSHNKIVLVDSTKELEPLDALFNVNIIEEWKSFKLLQIEERKPFCKVNFAFEGKGNVTEVNRCKSDIKIEVPGKRWGYSFEKGWTSVISNNQSAYLTINPGTNKYNHLFVTLWIWGDSDNFFARINQDEEFQDLRKYKFQVQGNWEKIGFLYNICNTDSTYNIRFDYSGNEKSYVDNVELTLVHD
jgi:hypothetical protein